MIAMWSLVYMYVNIINTFLNIFFLSCSQMRETKMVSVWLVGISGGLRFEGPTCHKGRITGWYTGWGFERGFQIDMAGKGGGIVVWRRGRK